MRETVVLQAIDQLRRDLSGYHEQLVAHNELERHCDNQRKRISELEGLLAGMKAENARLHEYATKLEQTNIALDSDNTELRNDMKDMQTIVRDNHSLRELVRHLFWWDSDSRYAKGCQECPTQTDCDGETCIFWDVLRDRARELGIEVRHV